MKKTVKQFGKRFMAMLLTLVMLSTLIVPGTIVFATADEVPTYSVDTSWYDTSKSSFTLTTPGQVLGFFYLLANTTDFYGKTINLGADVDLNPGWEGDLTVSDTTATFPVAPPNTIWTGDARQNSGARWFHGTFDGQYHTLSGVYSSYTSNAATSGIFGALARNDNGTLKCGAIQNLRIVNSYIEHKADNSGNDMVSSAICTCLRGTASITNCYFDVDLAVRGSANNKGTYTGAISQGGGSQTGTATLSNVVWAGTIFDANGSGDGNTGVKNGTTNGRIGMLYQNANSVALNVTDVLNMGAAYCNLVAQEGNGYSNNGHNSTNITATRFMGNWVKNSSNVYVQATNPEGGNWKFVGTLDSFIPGAVADGFFADAIIPVVAPVTSWYTGAGEGAEFVLTTAAEVLGFAKLLNEGTYFEGQYVKLGNDIDLNPGWDGNVVVEDGVVTSIPKSAPNVWPIDLTNSTHRRFRGCLDGQGHTLSGIYINYTPTAAGKNASLMGILQQMKSTFTDCGVRNLSITNSYYQRNSSQGNYYGIMAGLFSHSQGGVIENCYLDIDMVNYTVDTPLMAGVLYQKATDMTTTDTSAVLGTVIRDVVTAGTMVAYNYGTSTLYNNTTSDWNNNTRASQMWFSGFVCNVNSTANGVTFTRCQDLTTAVYDTTYVTKTGDGQGVGSRANFYNTGSGFVKNDCAVGTQATAPSEDWKYVYDLHSYVPGDLADTFFSDAIGEPVPDWLYPNRGEALLGTAAEVMAFIDYAQTHDFAGITVKLTADIDLNPGWSAKVTGTTTMTFPTEPDNVWTPIPMFKGSFDGQGYTLKGVYSYAESDADTSNYGGMFYDLENATIQNLRITNAFIGFKYTGTKQDAKQTFGGLAYRFLKRTVIQNVVFDAEVWNITDGGKMFGMLAVFAQNGDSNDVAHCPLIDDVVIMGRQALALTDGTYGSNIVDGSQCGAVFVNTNWWRPSISDVLVLTSFGSGVLAASGGTNNINWSVPLHRDTLTGAATVKYGVQDETSGWTYSKTLHSYVMDSVYTTFYEYPESLITGELVVDGDIMDFTEDDFSGSSYIVDSLEDWEYFVELANRIGTDGMAGMTIKLGADINFNTFDVTDTVANYSTPQANAWTVINTFKGTLDGQGHTLSGIYSKVLPATGEYIAGGLFNYLDGATITNLVITNSFIGLDSPVDSGSSDQRFGGIAGKMMNGTTISNVLFDAEVIARANYRMTFGGISSIGAGEIAIENFVFAGRYALISKEGVYNFNVDTYASGDKKFGYIFATGADTTISLTDVLVLAARGVNNMSAADNAGEDGKGYLVHWDNGNTTLDNAKIGAQAEAVGTWSYNESLASYAPVDYTVTLHTYTPKTRTDAAISTFDSRDSGSSYTVASAADLKLFSKIGGQGYNFAGDTVKLTADIDFNSGWVATPTVANGTVTFPSAPSNVWTQIPNFYGTLDGQGHAISGLYRYATGLGESGSAGGIFLNLVGATVKDLVITNSFFAAERTDWGSQNQKFGGLARSIQGATTIQDLFFNAEVWFKTDEHRTAGMLAAEVVNDGANLTVRNVVLAGRFGHVKNDMTIAASSGSSAKGVIAGNANNKTITLDQVLVAAEITLDAVKDTGTKLEKTVHYGNNNVNKTENGNDLGTLYYGLQAEQIGAWTWDGNLVSYSPTTLTANYIRLDVDAPLTMFNELAKPGSSYVITSMQDLLNFMQKINASSGKGAGYTFKLTTDVDLNPGWAATVEVGPATFKNDKGEEYEAQGAYFPSAPATSWGMPRFDGTFDGQGHYVAGIYRAGTLGNWQKAGGFCDEAYGATIKNVKFVNGLVAIYGSSSNNRLGALAGIAYDSNGDASGGTPFTAENVYIDMHVWIGAWGGQAVGGIIGQPEQNAILRNITFVGTVGLSNPESTGLAGKTIQAPSTSTSAAIGQAIGDPKGTGTTLENVVLAGTAYYDSGSHSGQISGSGVDTRRYLSTGTNMSNVLVGKYATLSAAENAGAITNESSPAYTAAVIGTETFLVTTSNYNMGLTDMPDGRPTTQSIQAYAPNTFYQGSVFTIATPADLIYAAELSQSGVTFSGYTLKLTADIDLNPGWDAAFELSNYREFNESRDDMDNPKTDEDGNVLKDEKGNTIYNKKDFYIYSYDVAISAVPAVTFPGFKEFYGTLDGQDHTISGLAMYKLFTKQDNLGFVEYLYGNIRNLKFNNGLIFAQTKNYNQSDSKIGGVAARIQSSSAVLENLYVDLNVWYQSGSAHRIGGIAAKTENGAHLTNVTFAGVVGTMRFANEGGTVPSQSTGLSISQLVADGNWKSALIITNCNMEGTVYADWFANNPTDTEISSNINATNVSGTGNGTYTGSSYSNNTAAFNIWPTATVDRYTASYEADTMTKTYYFETITRANFTAYIEALEAAGYTVKQNYSIGDSAYYLLQNGVYTVYASRIPSNGYTNGEMFRARVFVEPYGRDYNTNKTATAKSTYCAAQLWQLNVDNWYGKSSGGACYIMRLTDGRFLIVDSGFGSTYEGDNIYKILYENNVRDGDPIVAGWFFTHGHEDHVKGFERFVKESHLNDITVEAFYFNFPSHEVELASSESSGDGLSIEDTTATRLSMTAYPNAKVYSRVHSGQSFGFADTTVTVLYTHEDAGQSYWNGTTLYQNELKNGNDTSVMYQVKIGDEKILFTGDAYVGAENAVYYTFPASSYASKFVTVSHHSYEGLSKAFYQAVNPTVALWPMDLVRYVKNDSTGKYEPAGLNDEYSFNYRYTHTHGGNRMWEANHWFNTASSVKEVIPSFENACLTLPYPAKSYSGGNKTVGLSATYNSKANNTSKWDGAGGAGVTINEWYDAEADELHITSRKDLFDFMKAAQKGRTFAGQTVILDADISANPSWAYDTLLDNNFLTDVPEGLSVWQPIPNFAGTFDGQGHTIRNLYIPVTVSASTYNGGFIKSLTAGATITNLIIKSSAMVATYNVTSGSQETRIGAFIGRIVDPSTGEDNLGPVVLSNLYIDLDGYYVSGGIAAFAGLVGMVARIDTQFDNPAYSEEDKAAAEAKNETYKVPKKLQRSAQFVIENVVYAGDLICVAQNGQAGGTINIASDQQMWGPVGFIGKSEAPEYQYDNVADLTEVITNALFLGRLVKCSNGSDFRAAIVQTAGNSNNFGFNAGNVELTDAYGSAAAANEATPDGWTYFGKLESYIPDEVFAMLGAVETPVKAQQTDAYTPAGKTYEAVDVRFVGILNGITDEADLANYSEVGMKIKTKRNGNVLFEQELTTSTVYESIWAGNTLYEMEDAGGFLYAFVIKGVPLSQNIEFYITTFTVDADTSKPMNERVIYTEEQMFVYDGGLVDPNAAD